MGIQSIDFSSTKLRRAVTSVGIALTFVGVMFLFLSAMNHWKPLELLKTKGWTVGVVAASSILAGYLYSHIFLSKDTSVFPHQGVDRKAAGGTLMLGLLAIAALISILALQGAISLKNEGTQGKLGVLGGLALGSLVGFIFSTHAPRYQFTEHGSGYRTAEEGAMLRAAELPFQRAQF